MSTCRPLNTFTLPFLNLILTSLIYNLLFKNTRVFIIWLVFILAISYAVKFNNTSSHTKDFTPIEKISKGVAIQYSDKTTGYIDLPYTIKSSKPFNLYIDLKYFGA